MRGGQEDDWTSCRLYLGEHGGPEPGAATGGHRGASQDPHRQDQRQVARRAGLAEVLGYIRESDTVRVASMDRFGRSTRSLFDLVDEIAARVPQCSS
ncbi:recombinase family protein [Citricoccus nitrophenolicus]